MNNQVNNVPCQTRPGGPERSRDWCWTMVRRTMSTLSLRGSVYETLLLSFALTLTSPKLLTVNNRTSNINLSKYWHESEQSVAAMVRPSSIQLRQELAKIHFLSMTNIQCFLIILHNYQQSKDVNWSEYVVLYTSLEMRTKGDAICPFRLQSPTAASCKGQNKGQLVLWSFWGQNQGQLSCVSSGSYCNRKGNRASAQKMMSKHVLYQFSSVLRSKLRQFG